MSLAPKTYWDSVYENMSESANRTPTTKDRIKHVLRNYANFLLWEDIYPRMIPKVTGEGKKVIEVGCAPGKNLIEFSQKFGYEPFGVEYSEKGVEITKKIFTAAGVPASNVIFADFFSPEFKQANAGKYDLVFSKGFIEHFDDPKRVVDDHTALLRPGGLMVLLIPNLSGINWFFSRVLNNDSLKLHNTSIMNIETFSSLFDRSKLEPLFIRYVGTFNLGLFNTNSRLKYIIHRGLLYIQFVLNFLFRVIFGHHALESRYTSPYLVYIGKKK